MIANYFWMEVLKCLIKWNKEEYQVSKEVKNPNLDKVLLIYNTIYQLIIVYWCATF